MSAGFGGVDHCVCESRSLAVCGQELGARHRAGARRGQPSQGLEDGERGGTGIREGETPKMLHSRMCQRGWSPGAGLSPFYPSLPLEWQKVLSAGATWVTAGGEKSTAQAFQVS